MKYLLCSLSVSLLLLLCNAVEDELIPEITNSTFDDFIEGEDMVIIEFYASWCMSCHELKPTFLKVAENLKPHGIKFGKVNIEEEKTLQTRFSISQLPGMLMFRKGIVYKYAGPLGGSGPEEITDYFLKEKEKDYLGENPILILTEQNFDDTTSTSEIILVDFFVKECLKCKKLDPVFTAAARRLSSHKPPIHFGTVDVSKNMDLAKRFGIQNYPLLLMFRYGKMYNYTGEETEDGIVSYMKKHAGPSSTFLEDLAAVKKFINSPSEAVAVGFFSSETSATVLESFIESGNIVRQDIRLGHTTDSKIAKQLKFDVNSVIVYHPKHLVSKYETGYSKLPNIEHKTSEDLGMTLTQAAKPLVGQVTLENFGTLYAHRPLLVAYYDVDWDREHIENTKYWHSLIAGVASKFKSTEVEFAIGKESDFPQILRALGLGDWGEEVAIGLFAPGLKKYRMTEEVTRESLTEFIEDFLEGELTSYYMSETPPRKGVGPVRTVVGSTFSKIVYDSSKNVMLKICIPTISACLEAAEWYPKAADKYKLKDLVFGEINVELNDIPLTFAKFDNLPIFVFSPKGSKGEGDLVMVNPMPENEHDLTMWLRQEFNIKTNKRPKSEL